MGTFQADQHSDYECHNSEASAGRVGYIIVNNTNFAVRYLKLYDKASAPIVGVDSPKLVIAIPRRSTLFMPIPPWGIRFDNGIGFGITTGIADTDTGAVGANEHALNIGFT